MTEMSEYPNRHRSDGLTFLSIVNAVAFVVTLLFWGMVFLRHLVPFPSEMSSLTDRASSAVTYGFMIGDVLYSLPLLLLASLGIWRLTTWGWAAAQMANILWIYSMTVILFRDAFSTMSPGGLLFIPFTLVAIWAIPFLWVRRKDFGING